MPTYSTSTPAATIRTETEPSAADYQFWIKPSTNEAFFSDGTTWQEIPTGAPATAILGIENALNILEIQAADTITPDTSAQIASDIFSDTTGYNNTIDTGNTTAFFDTDKYTNENILLENATQVDYSTDATFTLKKTLNVNPDAQVYECTALVWNTGSSSPSTVRYKYYYSDATTADVDVSTSTATPTLRTFDNPQKAKTVTQIEVYLSRGASNGIVYESTSKVYGSARTDTIIQTSKIDLPSTPSKFIVFAFRDETSGTGTIDADISFDNGANYQTGVSLNTETSIIDAGDEMILKLNLNAGASAGMAEAKGYGVLFW